MTKILKGFFESLKHRPWESTGDAERVKKLVIARQCAHCRGTPRRFSDRFRWVFLLNGGFPHQSADWFGMTEILKGFFESLKHRPWIPTGDAFLYLVFASLASLRSALVLKNRSSSGTRIRQIRAAVKPPLYRQKPPCILGTLVTSR